ncbi:MULTISPECIES: acetyl/propionyl/methylcrotonyl-CoA carboxylase subunit alpha [unclassified Sphingomonas]|uniref:acetyl/propionyl/methylcrotonyl-CoA carboxylase subunit alpha n=1 Tax=Sphingomonas TaxID=13687 RepID=UPI00095AEE05|nr:MULTISPECIES: acetyl/propionyl/methylcrotonyl-CoA carboxylase subunit alpha [unclassified Sphingomonas]MBN8813069.1 acetyl/propionyl/methylcrotonyl-CoA carboxylase subunit alpha [Sphingomonas sp.]OJY54205.1 MAG: methylcrotonoyl-CoA carboxylase [Sphingomonas sp. 67-41]
MIQSLLIANRGEIACRIIRTARDMGIRTVAVYSDADAKALHVREADEAVHIGPSPARDSYLVGEKIIAAARQTGAEAIHPGYGFLSENADFAEAVVAAGLTWVGPRPDSIRAMGLKDAAKERMIAAGVPVTPGYLGENQDPAHLRAEADKIGYPVLIKAVAGGGGKGMRRVDAAGDFADALASCQREAAASFGDDRVLIEKYILSPRHIEVQVFGDTHGNVVHLFERDCSLQRRHQKVIEEAPAPGMDPDTRAAICAAAVRAARAVDYVGAGTIEFIADASEGLRADRIWFMEMNTRLQVEHPVTEEITGQDLVEWQLRVASGEKLPLRQDELSIQGWAMEARLYAEDPAKGFLPSIGALEIFRPHRGVRLETGVYEGAEISPFYDPMIAKIVVHEESRDAACEALARACAATDIYPVKTNAPFLWRALDDADFRAGRIDTGFIAARGAALLPPPEPTEDMIRQAAAAILVQEYYGEPTMLAFWDGDLLSAPQPNPLRGALGFRLNAPANRKVAVNVEGKLHHAELPVDWRSAEVVGEPVSGGVAINDDGLSFLASLPRAAVSAAGAASDGAILAPMPGRVTAVEVAAGDAVTKGQRLVTLEAMKMEHGLTAPFDGIVGELPVAQGSQVSEGTLLVKVEKTEG